MKEVAILLVLALLLNGCGASSTAVQTAASGGWQAEMFGGEGTASGFSFIAQWTVTGSGGALTVSDFQFLTAIPGGCFPVNGEVPTGTLNLVYNSADQLIPPSSFSFVITASGNTLTLSSLTVTGTYNSVNGTFSDLLITGNWALTGGTGCNGVNGSFTMTQTASG
jgi:hypothetical protein